mgnify:CR=1 FL=1
MYNIMFVEMSLAKKTVVDVEEWTARNTVRNMYPGHAIDLKSRHMCAITVQRKSFAQKTNIFIVQSMLMQLSHEDGVKADKGFVFLMKRNLKWMN